MAGVPRIKGATSQRHAGELAAQNDVSAAGEESFQDQVAVGVAGEYPLLHSRKRRRKPDYGTALILSHHRNLLNPGEVGRGVVGQRIVETNSARGANYS